jgi:hypothetical protein
VIVAVVLGIALAAALWWAYFDLVMLTAELRLSAAGGEERARLALDSYGYLHLPMVAGIIFIALGIEQTITLAVLTVLLCGLATRRRPLASSGESSVHDRSCRTRLIHRSALRTLRALALEGAPVAGGSARGVPHVPARVIVARKTERPNRSLILLRLEWSGSDSLRS